MASAKREDTDNPTNGREAERGGLPENHQPTASASKRNEHEGRHGSKIQSGKKEIHSVEKPTGARLYILFAAVFFSTFLMALNGSIIATAIPKITSHFKSLEDIGWYGSAYLVATCSVQPLTGKIYTHFPIKQTYVIFCSIFLVGSLVSATAASSKSLIVGRAVQGIGGAGILSGSFITIVTAAPKGRKPILVGTAVGLSSIGTVIGPLIGGALTESVSWRWCFYINLPLSGFVICILSVLSIPEQMRKPPVKSKLKVIVTEELDLVGFALFASACVMFLLAMIWGGNQYDWNSSTIIGLFCGAFVTFILFTVWQLRRGDKAMIPPKMARKQLVIFGCWTSFFQVGALLLVSYYLPLWFQVVKRASAIMSGVMVLPTAISQAFGGVAAGKFVEIFGYYTPWAIFGSALTVIGSSLMTTFSLSTGTGAWIGYQVLVGTGRGSVVQMPVTAVQNLLPPKEVAIATSQVFFFQYLGGAVFLAVGETIFTNSLRSSLETYAPNVSPEGIIELGASAVRSTVSDTDLGGVLHAYNHAIVQIFYLAIGGASAAFLTSFGIGWQKIPTNKDRKEAKGNDA